MSDESDCVASDAALSAIPKALSEIDRKAVATLAASRTWPDKLIDAGAPQRDAVAGCDGLKVSRAGELDQGGQDGQGFLL